MSTKSSLQSLLTHPLAGSATAREICDFIGPDKCLPALLFRRPKFSRNLKKSKFQNFHI